MMRTTTEQPPGWDTTDLDQGVATGPEIRMDAGGPTYAADDDTIYTAAVYWSDVEGTTWFVTEPTPSPDQPIPDHDIVEHLRRRASALWSLAAKVEELRENLPAIEQASGGGRDE
ncbi:hypothetical protein GCM10027418_06360 [Mariniluteicoccus endophyticus]